MDQTCRVRGDEPLSQAMLNALPLPVFVLDEGLVIQSCNRAATQLSQQTKELLLRRSGEAMNCLHSSNGCGQGAGCGDCMVRKSVSATFTGRQTVRQSAQLQLVREEGQREVHYLITTSPFPFQGRTYALLILEDITELMTLRKLLPICARCKKIRDDQQYWHHLETYMSRNLHVDLTHGYCPDCVAALRAEMSRMKAIEGPK